jgi:hypothetical protein
MASPRVAQRANNAPQTQGPDLVGSNRCTLRYAAEHESGQHASAKLIIYLILNILIECRMSRIKYGFIL